MRRLGILLGLALLAAGQWAQADAEAEADYRHHVMEAVGGHMQAMATILKKQVHLDELSRHASSLADMAAVAPGIFPEGSLTGDSKALPAIWENPEDFQKAMQRFVSAANDMATAAQTSDMSQIGPAISKLGNACKGCHDSYKAE